MKSLPVLIEFQGIFTDFSGEKILEEKPKNTKNNSYCETLFFLEEYDCIKTIDLLRFAIVYSEGSPQCFFQDCDANAYLTYEIFCDWIKEEKELKKILRKLFKITGVYVEDYLVNRLCCISISYPKSWDDKEPEFWRKVYAG